MLVDLTASLREALSEFRRQWKFRRRVRKYRDSIVTPFD